MRIKYFLFLWLLASLACRQKRKAGPFDVRPSVIAQIDSAHYTRICWKDSVLNFGNITEGDSVKLVYSFINCGKTPLYIASVRPVCGCTVSSFSEQAILPGDSGYVKAIFNSHGHPGSIIKSIRVTANTVNGTSHRLIFKGMVTKKETTE